MIVYIVIQAFQDVLLWETEFFNLINYFLIYFEVVIHRIVIRFQLPQSLPYKVFIHYLALVEYFFFECIFSFLFLFLFFVLALVVCILMVDSIVKVLIVKLFVLSVALPDSGVEPDGHVLVNQHILDVFVNRLGIRTCLGVEGTQDHRTTGVILHQSVLV